jgi:ABC-2 type transport system permease protein
MMQAIIRYTGMARIAVRERMQYRFDFFMTLLSTLMFSALFYMIWRAIYAYSTETVLPWTQLITYIMMGQAINFSRWSPAERAPVYNTASSIRNGDIALDLIRPVGFQSRRLIEAVGYFVVELLWVTLPVILIYVVFLGISPPGDIFSAAGFLLSVIIAFFVSFSLNSIIMMTSFWTTNARGVQIAKKAAVDILAGTIIPFEFFPSWFRIIVDHMPFKGMAYIPLSIYTGKMAGYTMIYGLLEQIAWAAVMFCISRILWLRASSRIIIHGG